MNYTQQSHNANTYADPRMDRIPREKIMNFLALVTAAAAAGSAERAMHLLAP